MTSKQFDDIEREIERMREPSYLRTVSMSELYDTVFEGNPALVDGLIYPGTYLFVGAPKTGKSFFMAQIAYHVSTGTPLWGYPVRRGAVLYLALEDGYARLQKRLYRMFGTEGTENLSFAISAGQLGCGLDEQLERFVREHTDTNLIIIDTLQKVREAASERFSYASDYDIITRFKHFADSHGICLLLVHHTRKQPADDRFDMISGTNGLLGAADGALLLQKEKRTQNAATLDISGRDQQDQRLYLVRDTERLTWLLEKAETELWVEPKDPVLEAVAVLLSASSPTWHGNPTELAAALSPNTPPNVLTRHLNVNAARLRDEYGIGYASRREHGGRRVTLSLAGTDSRDGRDGCDGE